MLNKDLHVKGSISSHSCEGNGEELNRSINIIVTGWGRREASPCHVCCSQGVTTCCCVHGYVNMYKS